MKQKRIRYLMISLGLTAIALGLIAWVMPLVDYADATFIGTNSYDRAGESVAMVGDVNDDGYDDFLIGARAGDVIANNGGGVYLFLGGPEASWGSDVPVNQADATFGSAGYQDYAGHDIAGAGDINGDGYADFLVGADGYDAPGCITQTGRVHLFLGRQAADWGQGVDVATSDASFVGEAAYANTGHSVAGAGDVNGDGYDDFLFSAHPEGTANIYLYLGRANPDWGSDASLSTADASFVLDDPYGEDVSVAGVGDVNGDGYDDFLVGSYSIEAYLILGKAAADWGQDFDLANADAILELEHADVKVAGVGDVNSDGLDDMLVASRLVDAGEINNGKSYLILGRATADWGSSFDLASGADASFFGANSDDQAGCTVSGAGDANRDGYDDFLIGACFADATDTLLDTGGAYLVLGRPDGWQLNIDLTDSDTATDFAFLPGEATEDQAGTGLAGGGDVNGDGFGDVLVGALDHNRDASHLDVGKVYLMLGTGLALKKTAGAYLVEPGGLITYTLNYTNTNVWPVQAAFITDPVPAHTTYMGCTGGVSCGLVSQTVRWNLGAVPADSAGSVELVLQVLPDTPRGTFILNTAAITAPSRLNPVHGWAIVRVSGGPGIYLPLVVRDQP
jgi:uncharacterized repeat protein (TIGR01451 family)